MPFIVGNSSDYRWIMNRLWDHFTNGKMSIMMSGRRSGYTEYMIYEALLSAYMGETVEIHCVSEYHAKKIIELLKEVATSQEMKFITILIDSKCEIKL